MKNSLFYPFIVSFFIALIVCVFFVLSFKTAVGSDFVSYLTGAYIVRSGYWDKLYDLATQYRFQQIVIYPNSESSVLPYVNIPILALVIVPFTYLPLLTAYKIFVLVLLLVVGIFSFFVHKAFKYLRGSLWVLIPFIFYPSFGSIFEGQITPIILLDLILIFVLFKNNKESLAGLLTSFLLFKIQYVILFAYLLALTTQRKKFLKGFLLGSIVILGVSLFLSKGGILTSYFPFIFSVQKPELGTRMADMLTLHASLSQIFKTISYKHIFIINSLLFLVSLTVFYLKRKKLKFEEAFAVAIIFTLVFSVHSVNYDYALLLIPIFYLLNEYKHYKNLSHSKLLALLLLLLLPILFISTTANTGLLVPYLLFLSIYLILKKDGYAFYA